MSPAVYDEMAKEALLARDVANIRRSMQEIDAGKGTEAGEFFDGLRARLLAMKKAQRKKAAAK